MSQSDNSVYQDAFEASLDAIVCSDETGYITLWNPAAEKIFGYSLDEALGQPLTMLMTVADQKKHTAGFNHFIDTEKTRISGRTVEVSIRRKDGMHLPVELSLSSRKSGEGWKFTAILRDITARKHAEEALEKNEHRYRDLVEFAPVCIHEISLDGKIISMNRSGLEMIGLDREEQITGSLFLDNVGEGDFQRISSLLGRAYQGVASKFEFVGSKALDQRIFLSSLIPISGNGGEVLRVMGVSQDITEQKQAESKLKASEKKMRSVFSNISNVSIQGYDENRRVTFWNEASEKLYGYSYREAINRRLEELIIPDEMKPVVISSISKWLNDDSNKIPHGELLLVRKDGSPVHVYSSHVMTEDSNGNREMFCVDIDISDQKRAEQNIQNERDAARLYLNTASVMVLVINKNKSVALANRKACEVLGYAEREIIGKNWFENFLPADQREDVANTFDMLVEGNLEPAEFYENTVLTKDGRQRIVAWHNAVLRDERGNVISILSSGEDVTERKQMEKRLQFTQFAVDRSADMAFWLTPDANFFYVNESLCKTLGYSREEMLGKSVHDINPDFPPDVWRTHWDETQAKGTFSLESSLQSKCGEMIPVEITANYMEFDGVELNCSFARNISERKQAMYFSGKTAEILEMVASGVAAGRIYNAICAMYEEKHPNIRTSILRRKGNQLFHCSAPSLPEEYSQAIDGMEIGACTGSCGTAAFLGRGVIVENIAIDPLWEDFRSIALPHKLRACWSEPVIDKNGEVAGTFAMYYDQPAHPNEDERKDIRNASGLVSIVMDREQRQASLRILSQAIEQAGESVIITDRNGTIEYVNPSFTRITGYTAKEVLGENPRILKSGNQTTEYYEDLWATISSGRNWHGSVIDRRKDGSQYPAMMSIAPILNDDGEITHYVGIQQDMTDYEALEQQFYQAQKMEAIGTLVGGIAHDFNNMLAGMTGNLYLARQKIQEQPDVVQKLANVEAISFRAADMVQQLLTFARKDRVSMRRLPLAPFIKETIKFLHSSVPENIAVYQDICEDSLQINGDATQLHQVLMNLINNARDALEGVDHPSITIRLASFQVDELFLESHTYFDPGIYARLSIEDNGHGIPACHIEHLFEPFFTTKEEGKGTGLGLAMVFGAIKTHQGFIEVESIEKSGTTFHIYLPLLELPDHTVEESQAQEVVKGHGEMILLVDDQTQIVDTGKDVLESLGYQVLTAANGQLAIDLFEKYVEEIDLVILDVVMPVLGGNDAARRIRQIKPQVKIIMSTGYDKNIQSDMETEIVLGKPFSIVEMSHLIRQQLNS